jgi:hypothetical protein
MRRFSVCLGALILCSTMFGIDRKAVFLDKMDGFEVYIERAIEKAELESKIDLVEESEHPELKAMLGKRFSSVYAEALYRKNTGRASEDTTLTLVDVANQKTLLTHNFKMGGSESSKQQSADEFVSKLRKLLEKPGN